jgi:tetratricopeptide (TPR) repeat protein
MNSRVVDPKQPAERTRSLLRHFSILCIGAGLVAVGFVIWRWLAVPDASRIKRALAARRIDEAVELANRRLRWFPEDYPTRLVLGEAYQRQHQLNAALAAFDAIPATAGSDALTARLVSASMLIHEGRLADAQQALESAAAIEPHHATADELQVAIYTLTGQRWLSLPVLHRIVARPNPSLGNLIYLANPDEMPAPPDDLFAKIFKVGDPLDLLGAAHVAASLGRNEQSYELIDRCLAQRPDLIDAYVLKGTVLVDEARLKEFDRLLEQTPDEARSHPVYWFNLGRRAHQEGNVRGAIRCYWEVLRRQPNHDRATYQIGQVLSADGNREAAQRFLDRGQKLTRLVKLAIELFSGRQDDQQYWDCAQLTHQLGRLPEARAWCELLLERNPRHPEARQLLQLLRREWTRSPPPLLPDNDLAADFPGESYPLPTFSASPPSTSLSSVSANRVRFEDEAEKTGMAFRYFSGDDPQTPGKRMFEYTGGGVAVLDYDLDGWPDVFLTQGSAHPGDLDQRTHLDVLYRNDLGRGCREVAAAAGIVDAGFGQGTTVGDFDNDGFPDLYLANIDGNRLFHNRGDGTFADVTAAAGLGHPYWTTSCLLADIDGDGVVDAYDVTFLEGEDVFNRVCQGNDGVMRSCAPAGFAAAPDQVSLGRGDGTFDRVSPEAGFAMPDGDGLGIVAADFDRSGKLSLFIGNDGRANFLFVPEPSSGPTTRWSEVGVLSGVAFDEGGMAHASMGIAASDANNDGLVDLFITNFYMESNNLLVNLGALAFTDRARSAGLREPSLAMLGFGTQFLDADRDGWEDLLLVNGHVDDFTHKQIPYKMPAQYFENRQGRFREIESASLGGFFRELRLGRGLATLDWNRDGLPDAVASNIDDPAALLTNRTKECGAGVRLRLVGRTRSRDAIGARVVVHSGGDVRERQLTAGDGYQSSNERCLFFGLGEVGDQATIQVDVDWPGGGHQRFDNVEIGGEYLAVEGRESLVSLARPGAQTIIE